MLTPRRESALGGFCFIRTAATQMRCRSLRQESFQPRNLSNCSNRVKLSVSLSLGHHCEHGIAVGPARVGKQRLNSCNEGFVFLWCQRIDLAAFRLERPV